MMIAFILSILLIPQMSLAEDNALFAFARLNTSHGDIRLKLYKKDAPETVNNFVGLASGWKPFRDVETGKKVKDTPFYTDMVFHKVHPELGIQTGCPWGNGKGWPGYTLQREKNELKFDKPYLVTMAQIPGDTGSIGSQFLITTKSLPHLDKDYTVIGEVVTGFEIVDKIARMPRDAMMKPLNTVKLNKITIE